MGKEIDKVKADFEKSFDEMEKQLPIITTSINFCNEKALIQNRYLWNLVGHINLTVYDLKIAGYHLIFENRDWKKRYFARQASLVMYESIEDLLELFGTKFRLLLRNNIKLTHLENELNQSIHNLNAFKNENDSFLKEIRHMTAAHREHDVIKFMTCLDKIEWVVIAEKVIEFSYIVNSLAKVVNATIKEPIEGLKV